MEASQGRHRVEQNRLVCVPFRKCAETAKPRSDVRRVAMHLQLILFECARQHAVPFDQKGQELFRV